MTTRKARLRVVGVAFLLAMCLVPPHGVETLMMTSPESEEAPNQVLEWNRIFIEMLIDDEHSEFVESAARRDRADGGLRCLQRHRPALHAHLRPARTRLPARRDGPPSLLPRTRPWSGCFQRSQAALDARYAASLAALSDDGGDGGQSRERGIAWGTHVAQSVLAWRANDGFAVTYPAVHRRNCGRPVASDASGIRPDERAGAGIHRHVRAGQQQPVPACHRHEDSPPPPTRTISTPSRRSAAARDRPALPIRSRSRRSGKGTRAFIGTRRPIRSRARTICRCRRATGCSRVLNIAMADTAFTTWSAQAILRREPGGSDLAPRDGDSACR